MPCVKFASGRPSERLAWIVSSTAPGKPDAVTVSSLPGAIPTDSALMPAWGAISSTAMSCVPRSAPEPTATTRAGTRPPRTRLATCASRAAPTTWWLVTMWRSDTKKPLPRLWSITTSTVARSSSAPSVLVSGWRVFGLVLSTLVRSGDGGSNPGADGAPGAASSARQASTATPFSLASRSRRAWFVCRCASTSSAFGTVAGEG